MIKILPFGCQSSGSSIKDIPPPTNWGIGFSRFSTALLERVFQELCSIRQAREVCRDWKGMIDVVTGVGEGKLTHDQLIDKVMNLARQCLENNLIPENRTIYNKNGEHYIYNGYNDFIEEAKKSYSDALNAYWHLKAREGVLTDPMDHSRMIHHVDRGDIPYIPLSRPVFAKLFQDKIKSLKLSEKESRNCFTFYPCRRDVYEWGIMLYDHNPGFVTVDQFKGYAFDLKRVQEDCEIIDGTSNPPVLKTPIFFSKDEILQLKRGVLSRRSKNREALVEVITKGCFYDSLDREGAMQMLKGCPPGTYLIRPSISGKYDGVFSYTSTRGAIVHAAYVVILDKDKPQFFFEQNGLCFGSLEDIIKYMSFWKKPLNVGTEIKAETKKMWSYIYTLPCYFPMAKTADELRTLVTDSSKQHLFFFYDPKEQCLTMGSWFKDKLEITLIDENKFAELKSEVLDLARQKNIVLLENTKQKLPAVNDSKANNSHIYGLLEV